jgi:hypothetical protein
MKVVPIDPRAGFIVKRANDESEFTMARASEK